MCPRSSSASSHDPRLRGPLAPVVYQPRFRWEFTCLLLARVVISIEVALGGRDGQTANEKVISAAPIVAFVVLAGVGVRVLAGHCGRAVRSRADEVAQPGSSSSSPRWAVS
jgi:hypothetical protein